MTPLMEIPPLYKPSVIPAMEVSISSRLAREAQCAAEIFSAESGNSCDETCWIQAQGDIAMHISERARFADLVILGQYEWQEPPHRHPMPIAHSVVLQCGRPVLVVPAVAEPRVFRKIVVAWDGSREAVRAVHDALPILQQAQTVQILTISRSVMESAVAAEDLLTHLASHRIKADSRILDIVEEDEDALLCKCLADGNFDLAVMGAYSHPRWRQMMFGGTTQSILFSSRIPVLVSH